MDENKNQSDPQLSPEEQLDQLLAKVLADPGPETTAEDNTPDPMPADPSNDPAMPSIVSPDQEISMDDVAEQITAEEVPEEVPEAAEETFEEISEEVSEEICEEVSAEISEEMPEEVTEETPDETEQDIWPVEGLDAPVLAEEIGPDEQAVAAVGLTHPEDLALEQIVEDTLQDVPPSEEDAQPTEDEALVPAGEEDTEASEDNEEPSAEEPEEPEEAENLPPRKTRPKNTKAYGLFGIPHMVSTLIWLALVVFIGVGLGRMIWLYAADMLAFGREERTVTITITASDDLDSIAEKLHKTGLIEYPGFFKIYGKLANIMEDINTGTYKLSTLYDYNALVDQMSATASRVTINVTIPEGYTCSQIFHLLEQKGVCSAQELEDAAAYGDLGEYWFLEGVERGTATCLEGYLFPDTYTFYLGHSPEGVLEKFLVNFNKQFTDIMKEKLDVLNETLSAMMRSHGLSEDYIASHQMTIREVTIIASMIEKETANYAESYTISSVIYNRLTNPNAYPFLNIDAALVYITGHNQLTDEDKLFDSPYNTYLYTGLIPGPISNPGRASLDAALDPENTGYHFYALDPSTGMHRFFKTYAEHLAFLESLRNNEE